jgi:YD repeat-containing protein
MQESDLTIASATAPIAFNRTYVSLFGASGFPVSTLGAGWRHTYAEALTLPSQSGGETGTVIYEAATGNRLRFFDAGSADTVLDPAPGVRASLLRSTASYTLTLRDQAQRIFDTQGRLTATITPAGHRQTLTYYAAPGTIQDGQLERVTDVGSQRTLTLSYLAVNGSPRVSEVVDHTGRRVQYDYTSSGELHTVTDVRNGVTTYGYVGTPPLLSTVTDPTGLLRITNSYDAQRRVYQQTDVSGLVTTYSYATTSTGRATTITQQAPGMPADVLVDHYRSDGTLEYQTRNGQFLGYQTFSAALAPTTQVDAAGNVTLLDNDGTGLPTRVTDAENGTTTLAYRPDKRLTTLVEPSTITTTLTYDAAGNPTTVAATGSDGLRTTTVLTYTANNQVFEQRAPDDVVTRYAYDPLGQVTSTTVGFGTTLAQTTGYEYDSLGREVRYDALGRVFETVDPLGSVSRTTFDGLGRVRATTAHYVDGVFDPNTPDTDVTTTQTFDALSQVLTTTDPTGATTRFAYDALGRTTTVTDTVSRGTGTRRWTATPDGRLNVVGLDSLGRETLRVANYQNGVADTSDAVDEDLITSTVYDVAGRRWRTIEPGGRIIQFAYDNLDRLIAVTENVRDDCATLPSDSVHRPCNVITRYEYDRAGNRTAIVDANGNRRSFAYDAADQTITHTDGLNQVTRWEYDAGGRVLFERDPRGASYDLSYSYDQLDRQSQLSSAQVSGAITAQYDALGRRTTLGDASGTTSFAYGTLGRITGVSAPQTGSVGYGYNARGDRTRLTYPDNSVVSYDYLPDGQLWHVLQGTTPLATYGYDPAGRLSQVLRANGALTSYSYDDADRLRDLHTTVGGATVSWFEYNVDQRGLRRSVTETLGQSAPPATPTPTTPPAETPTPSPTGTATPTPTGSFYRAINLGGDAVTIDGNAWEGSSAANYSTNGSTLCNTRCCVPLDCLPRSKQAPLQHRHSRTRSRTRLQSVWALLHRCHRSSMRIGTSASDAIVLRR